MAFEGGLGGTLVALAAYGGAFGVTLGLFWSHFEDSLGICGCVFGILNGHFAVIFESLCVY